MNKDECCKNCLYLAELYTPPKLGGKAKHEYCCTMFLNEGWVMNLETDISSLCECFVQNNGEEEKIWKIMKCTD